MPVGCLGVSSRSGAADSSLYLNQADSAAGDKVETMVENIEIMQHRLLIQLMRLPEGGGRGGPQLTCDACDQVGEHKKTKKKPKKPKKINKKKLNKSI